MYSSIKKRIPENKFNQDEKHNEKYKILIKKIKENTNNGKILHILEEYGENVPIT